MTFDELIVFTGHRRGDGTEFQITVDGYQSERAIEKRSTTPERPYASIPCVCWTCRYERKGYCLFHHGKIGDVAYRVRYNQYCSEWMPDEATVAFRINEFEKEVQAQYNPVMQKGEVSE